MVDRELNEIKAKVDETLEQLQRHMEKMSNTAVSREEAAQAIYNYVTPHSLMDEAQVSLKEAMIHAVDAKAWGRSIDEQAQEQLGKDSSALIAAVDILAEWGRFGGQPLEHHHMRALWIHAFRYREGVTRFFGEDGGLQLKKNVMPDKDRRLLACDHLLRLRAQDGGKKRYPLSSDLTWEDVGAVFNVPGGTLRDYYYSEGKTRLSDGKEYK